MTYTTPSPSTVSAGDTFPASAYNIISNDIQDHESRIKTGIESYTTTQKNALTGVTTGTMIYDSTLNQTQTWTGSTWVTLQDSTKPTPFQSIQRLAFQTRTTNLNINTTLALTGNLFSTSATFTAAGSTAYRIEVYAPIVGSSLTANDSTIVHLTDGSNNSLCRLSVHGSGNGAQNAYSPLFAVYYYTPSAGTVTLNVSATTSSVIGTPAIYAGAGTANVPAPATIAVFGPPLT
ncbi:hypothetical protein UFOVP1158_28 [uncultured Caudovirales phage]|uniref:Uncharacterized protein n=1 Tax=uncultured Caudovirales phage TaxID=2100421 RepID=A0A6J5R3Y5_9CAUD|nr:hypothetical protein UFOVP1158_28 [uncultured Caudovirales phage]